jgi:hypothetical protein
MAFDDPSPAVRCRHACTPCVDAARPVGDGEPVSPEAAGALPRPPRETETPGPDNTSGSGSALTTVGLGPLLTVVQPDTLIKWHRQGWRLLWRWKSRSGRPPIPLDLRRLIVSMAQANPTWGEERIANELRVKLGLTVSPRTVGRYLRTLRPPRGRRRSQRWATFVRNHAHGVVACDFFTTGPLSRSLCLYRP